MKLFAPGCTIVIAGFWNRMLLGPEWVSKNLFEGKPVEVAVPIMPANPLRFKAEKAIFLPASNRITISSEEIEEATWQALEDIASRLLNALPHTPVTAFGINLQFQEDVADSERERLFDFPDNIKFIEAGYNLQSSSIQRTFLTKEGLRLNLKIDATDQGITNFILNFHFQIDGDADKARQLLSGKTVQCKSIAYQLMQNLYNITFEGTAHG